MIKDLQKTLREDKEYYYAWQSNIAMAFYDEYNKKFPLNNDAMREALHEISNNAAKYFLSNLMRETIPDQSSECVNCDFAVVYPNKKNSSEIDMIFCKQQGDNVTEKDSCKYFKRKDGWMIKSTNKTYWKFPITTHKQVDEIRKETIKEIIKLMLQAVSRECPQCGQMINEVERYHERMDE